MKTQPVCQQCGKPDERKTPKPLCIDCYDAEVAARQEEPSFRASFRRQMHHDRLMEVQLERWLTGRWPIVAPKPF